MSWAACCKYHWLCVSSNHCFFFHRLNWAIHWLFVGWYRKPWFWCHRRRLDCEWLVCFHWARDNSDRNQRDRGCVQCVILFLDFFFPTIWSIRLQSYRDKTQRPLLARCGTPSSTIGPKLYLVLLSSLVLNSGPFWLPFCTHHNVFLMQLRAISTALSMYDLRIFPVVFILIGSSRLTIIVLRTLSDSVQEEKS